MTRYWAIDYVGDYECELVVGNQLYATEDEAARALGKLDNAKYYEVNWYTLADLEDDVYTAPFHIDENLKVIIEDA